ncbi:hypothetical protein O6H91_01G103700 [Diphasiastrum complanatum]|uniref:Uncharacterized protein n=1 Tax=Diphasiastrum complanatum TaxID=34168 RepID=A0ACC2EU20_DIPCM|nr:hypothetical protein O6H91_01G103700 [Diphasiastrum complanatum]
MGMAMAAGGLSHCERLPEAILAKILALLPAQHIAGVCALVCRAWNEVAKDPALWSHLCEGSGLKPVDALRQIGGWKALFASVYGSNLVASPHFERLHHIEADRLKAQVLRPWETRHRLLLDRITCLYDHSHDEYKPYCHWAAEGGSVFQRGGGDGIVREQPPVNCPPCPAAPHAPVVATSYDWGKLQQYVGLQTFSNRFLNASPPLFLSVWYAGEKNTAALFKVKLVLRDELKNPLYEWASGELPAKQGEWQKFEGFIQGYPSGLRSIIVKVRAMSIPKIRGFCGAKITAVRLQFVPDSQVRYYTQHHMGKVAYGSP